MWPKWPTRMNDLSLGMYLGTLLYRPILLLFSEIEGKALKIRVENFKKRKN